VNLQANIDLARAFASPSQSARIINEDWCRRELYCPACTSNQLSQCGPNTRACDFTCTNCAERFELKSGKGWSRTKIVDAGYDAMIGAIRSDRTPNLFVMQYSPLWSVQNLLLIPRHFISESAIEKRRPLGLNARRAGWIGCNILLSQIPLQGRILVVMNGLEAPKEEVRAQYRYCQELRDVRPVSRGWALDVLNIINRIRRHRFTLAEIYEHADELTQLHPRNRNVKAKIRQQLQVLRDARILQFLGTGVYELR